MSGLNTPDPTLANAAAELEQKLLALDEALAVQFFDASSSDGTITARASAAGDLVALTISAALLTPAAGSGLPAALIPVLNAAIANGHVRARTDLASLAAGFSLPDLPAQPPVLPDIPGFREAVTSFQHQMDALEAAAATAFYVGRAADGKVEVVVNGLLDVTAMTLDLSLFSSADAPATAGFIQQALNLALRTARHDDACQETDAAAAAVARGSVRVLTAIVRDFRDTHPDFEPASSRLVTGLRAGLVQRRLGADGKPIFADLKGQRSITSAQTFKEWFTDVPDVNQALRLPLELRETAPGSGIFAFESSAFFPIDGQLLDNRRRAHNYHFTLELHTTFTYQGGEVLQFTSDDDLWVFINRRLAVDLGGLHPAASKSVELDALRPKLTRGQIYAFDLFFAERHTRASHLRFQTGEVQVPAVRVLTAIVRDFRDTHPDFEPASSRLVTGLRAGLVQRRLGADGKPIFADLKGQRSITSAQTFKEWFTDVPDVNQALRLPLELRETAPGSGIFAFESSAFFPIDGQLLDNRRRAHNYHFTLELHTTFTYQGGEVLQFTSDDDLWVFINRRLAVDLGGLHPAASKSVELDALRPKLTRGQIYAFDLFFAERHTRASHLRFQTGIATSSPGGKGR